MSYKAQKVIFQSNKNYAHIGTYYWFLPLVFFFTIFAVAFTVSK